MPKVSRFRPQCFQGNTTLTLAFPHIKRAHKGIAHYVYGSGMMNKPVSLGIAARLTDFTLGPLWGKFNILRQTRPVFQLTCSLRPLCRRYQRLSCKDKGVRAVWLPFRSFYWRVPFAVSSQVFRTCFKYLWREIPVTACKVAQSEYLAYYNSASAC